MEGLDKAATDRGLCAEATEKQTQDLVNVSNFTV